MPPNPAVTSQYGRKRDVRPTDDVITGLAERQHGLVARRQLLDAGFRDGAIDHRLRRGVLHIVYRGVYAVGHRILSPEARWMAAVLAVGLRGAASHRAAGTLHGLLRSELLEVAVPRARRPIRGIRIHQSNFTEDEVTTIRGIRVTTVPRTLLDLAAVLPKNRVARAINEAQFLGLSDPLSLPDLLERHRGRRGAATVRTILKDLSFGGSTTRSELESAFLAFVEKVGLPQPEVNASLFVQGSWLECDFVWRTSRLVVELDGFAAHTTHAAFERDRARDRALHVSGWRSVRVTWRQLHGERAQLAADLAQMLS